MRYLHTMTHVCQDAKKANWAMGGDPVAISENTEGRPINRDLN